MAPPPPSLRWEQSAHEVRFVLREGVRPLRALVALALLTSLGAGLSLVVPWLAPLPLLALSVPRVWWWISPRGRGFATPSLIRLARPGQDVVLQLEDIGAVTLAGRTLELDVGGRVATLRVGGHGREAREWLADALVLLRDQARDRRGRGAAEVPVVPRGVEELLTR